MWKAIRNLLRKAPTDAGGEPPGEVGSPHWQPLYCSDSPVGRPTEDRFERWPFAVRLAEGIAKQGDHNSLVIGIYGAWGEGKTSVLNLVHHALRSHDHIIPFRFNPWRYPDEAELLTDFFEALARTLGKTLKTKREKAGKLLRDYGTIAGGVAGAASGGMASGGGEAVQSLGELLAQRSLEKRKEQLEEILGESGQRVVIMIDDIDRLARKEIQAVFRLIKLTADFKNTTYVLAFDPAMVASAIGEQFGAGDTASGAAFIEKIVQVPLQLPYAPRSKLRSFALEAVRRVLDSIGTTLDDASVRRFVAAFDSGVLPAIRTPRDAARLANTVAFTMPMVTGEVNHCDFLLVQALQVFYPTLAGAVRRDPGLALGRLNPRSDHKEREAAKREVEDLLGTVSPDLREAARELLEELFPRIASSSRSSGYRADWDEIWTKEKRAASRHYFNRYFSLAVGEFEVSDLEIEAIVRASEAEAEAEVSEVALRELLAQQLNGQRDEELVMKLRLRADEMSPRAARRLAVAVASCGSSYSRKAPFFGVSVSSQAAMLIVELIDRCEAMDRVAAASEATKAAEDLPFALELVSWAQRGESKREKGLADPEWQTVRRVFAERVRDELTASTAILRSDPKSGVRALLEWGEALGFGQPRELVAGWLVHDRTRLLTLLRGATGTTTESNGITRDSDMRVNGYDAIAQLVEPERVLTTLRELFGESLTTRKYVSADDDDLDDLTLARQFAWIHVHRAELERKQRKGAEGQMSEGPELLHGDEIDEP